MQMVRPMISSQNAVVVSNDDPLTRTWIGDDRIQWGQILRPMPQAPRCPSGQPFRMVIFTSPREAALAAQWNPVLWPGTDERFTGYGVMGLPFRSGHYLAMRHMPASSIGPEHQTVWHCGPDGTWTFITDTGPQQRYARYFASNDSAQTVQLDIECSWDGSHSLRVVIVPDVLDCRIELAPTPATVLTAAIGRRLKSSTWRSKTFQRAIGAVTPYVLRAGRVGLDGTAPNGQRSTSAPGLIRACRVVAPCCAASISARCIRCLGSYVLATSGFPNAACSRSGIPHSRTSTPPGTRCHRRPTRNQLDTNSIRSRFIDRSGNTERKHS